MIITRLGEDYFRIQAGETVILINPTNQRAFRGAKLIINTQKPAFLNPSEEDNFLWVDHQGEYEIAGCQLRGFSFGQIKEKEITGYKLEVDELNLGIFDPSIKTIPENLKENFLDLDLLFGNFLLKEIKPKIIIPFSKGKNLEEILKFYNLKKLEEIDKLVIKKKDLSQETKVLWLKFS